MIATTPVPPYYAVIFTSIRTDFDSGYHDMATRMVEMAHDQLGFLGVESARNSPDDGFAGITVSYWDSLEAIRAWKEKTEHRIAQQIGRERWYDSYKVRICRVEREYGFDQL